MEFPHRLNCDPGMGQIHRSPNKSQFSWSAKPVSLTRHSLSKSLYPGEVERGQRRTERKDSGFPTRWSQAANLSLCEARPGSKHHPELWPTAGGGWRPK